MPANLNHYELVLFDFDGTIADTARDMINSLNLLLQEYSRGPVEYDDLRDHVSNGTPALLRHGFGLSPDDEGYEVLRNRYLQIYEDNLCVYTCLYPGTAELLDECESAGILWGIVTNKPEGLTRQIVDWLGYSHRVACIVGGDTLKQRKPDPEPVIHACELAGVAINDSIYVGDSWRDIEAGHSAGVVTVGVTYGYIPPEDNPAEWQADHLIDSISEVSEILWARGRDIA